jgi:hypothetical protein
MKRLFLAGAVAGGGSVTLTGHVRGGGGRLTFFAGMFHTKYVGASGGHKQKAADAG